MSQPHLKLPKAQASETLHDNNDNDPCGMVLSDRASFVNSCFKGLVCGGRLTRGNCDRGQNLIIITHTDLQNFKAEPAQGSESIFCPAVL